MTYEEYIQQELAKAEQAKVKEANDALDAELKEVFRVTERYLNGVLVYDVNKLGKTPVIFTSSSMDEVRVFMKQKHESDLTTLNIILWVVLLSLFFEYFGYNIKEMIHSGIDGFGYVLKDLGRFANFMLNLIS